MPVADSNLKLKDMSISKLLILLEIIMNAALVSAQTPLTCDKRMRPICHNCPSSGDTYTANVNPLIAWTWRWSASNSRHSHDWILL